MILHYLESFPELRVPSYFLFVFLEENYIYIISFYRIIYQDKRLLP